MIVESPISVSISWYPPDVQEWNGIITMYTIVYELLRSADEEPVTSELEPFMTFTASIPQPGFPLTNLPDPRVVSLPLEKEVAFLEQLQPYHVYQFYVYVENSAGESQESETITQIMPQSGEYSYSNCKAILRENLTHPWLTNLIHPLKMQHHQGLQMMLT